MARAILWVAIAASAIASTGAISSGEWINANSDGTVRIATQWVSYPWFDTDAATQAGHPTVCTRLEAIAAPVDLPSSTPWIIQDDKGHVILGGNDHIGEGITIYPTEPHVDCFSLEAHETHEQVLEHEDLRWRASSLASYVPPGVYYLTWSYIEADHQERISVSFVVSEVTV